MESKNNADCGIVAVTDIKQIMSESKTVGLNMIDRGNGFFAGIGFAILTGSPEYIVKVKEQFPKQWASCLS